jgi:hypothetical protein
LNGLEGGFSALVIYIAQNKAAIAILLIGSGSAIA